MSFFSPRSELGLVLDVGSSSVGAALTRFSHGEPAEIIHSLREFIPYQEKVDADRLLKDMSEALTRANLNIVKEGASHLSNTEFKHVDIKRMYFSFSSPWSATETRTLSIKKDRPFTFSRALLNDLMLSEEERFKKEAMETRKVLPEALSVIERRVLETRLNGYDVKDPFGKRAKEADISYFSGIVPRSIVERTAEASHVSHVSKKVRYFTFPLAAYSAVSDSFPGEKNFIGVRIGGEISDVVVVEDGMISESASFPKGQNPIVKAFAEKTGQTREEALSFIKLQSSNHADAGLAEKLAPILNGFLENWIQGFLSVLQRLSNSAFLPERTFLFIDGDLAPYLVRLFKEHSFDPVCLGADDLKAFVTFEQSAKKDALLAVAAAFGKRIYESENK